MKIAIVPGSFDPITMGHLDIITRASKVFDKVVVLVVINPQKKPAFSPEERLAFIRKSTEHLPNVEADHYEGLLVEYARKIGACAIVKGLRAMSDFEYEFQMALTNKRLDSNIETMFLTTDNDYLYLSSSLVKQLILFDGDITGFLPPSIHDEVIRDLKLRVKKQEA